MNCINYLLSESSGKDQLLEKFILHIEKENIKLRNHQICLLVSINQNFPNSVVNKFLQQSTFENVKQKIASRNDPLSLAEEVDTLLEEIPANIC